MIKNNSNGITKISPIWHNLNSEFKYHVIYIKKDESLVVKKSRREKWDKNIHFFENVKIYQGMKASPWI